MSTASNASRTACTLGQREPNCSRLTLRPSTRRCKHGFASGPKRAPLERASAACHICRLQTCSHRRKGVTTAGLLPSFGKSNPPGVGPRPGDYFSGNQDTTLPVSFATSQLDAMPQSRRTFQARVRIFDDEAGFQPRHLAGQTGGFHRVEHRVEVFVGGGCLVLRILAAVREDVVRYEFIIDGLLIKGAVGCFASHATA